MLSPPILWAAAALCFRPVRPCVRAYVRRPVDAFPDRYAVDFWLSLKFCLQKNAAYTGFKLS